MNRQVFDLTEQYRKLIEEDFLPYWIQHRDERYGGILNCISNDGKKRTSDQKFTWSQGRWLWILGKLYELSKKGLLQSPDCALLEKWMEETYDFLIEHAFMDSGKCCFLSERNGEKVREESTGCYDASIYADCFVLLGISQYIHVMGKQECIQVANDLYHGIVRRIESGEYHTEPYPVPENYQIHGIPMILINTTYEYIRMKRSFGQPCDKEIQYGLEKIAHIWENLFDGKYIREYVGKKGIDNKYLLDRHINPGHTLEDLWFMAEFLKEYGDLDKYLSDIITVAKETFKLGWDEQFGGLLRFADVEGGMPRGELMNVSYETLVKETWDMKLWWPHSEILYLFPYLYSLSGDMEMKALYEKSAEYVFSTFPNKEVGEWDQICKRDGTPEDRVVALPVKDPFHIMRNFIKIIELCQG